MYIVTIILCEVGLYCCEYPLNDPPPFFSGLSLVYFDLQTVMWNGSAKRKHGETNPAAQAKQSY